MERNVCRIKKTWQELRAWGEKGAIYFHTHPKEISASFESLNDVKCALYNLGEVIFTSEDILIIIPEKKYSNEKIQKAFQDAKDAADKTIEEGWSYDDAYGTYFEELRKNLPFRISKLKGLNLEHEREKYEKEYKTKSEISNKSRSNFDKIFGKGKITYIDVAREEANKENKKREEYKK